MNINIYYGGRGMLDDPTLYVINKMQEVLGELRVKVERYNLYELKNGITTLPQTLKNADGIILATTIEWFGIGGFMQQFLDACWLYGDKEKISHIYMCPIVMSTTYGEREGKTTLTSAWEILGGLPCSGICGYIADTLTLEMNEDYNTLIEKKAENMYRTINQKMKSLPASNQAVKQRVAVMKNIDLTPQESEQLSQYASDEQYVQKQKEDIQELASLFRDMMGNGDGEKQTEFVREFRDCFKPQPGFRAVYKILLEGRSMPLTMKVDHTQFQCGYEASDDCDMEIQTTADTVQNIIDGKQTFQRAFMGGDMKMKGDFKILRMLDLIFPFTQE